MFNYHNRILKIAIVKNIATVSKQTVDTCHLGCAKTLASKVITNICYFRTHKLKAAEAWSKKHTEIKLAKTRPAGFFVAANFFVFRSTCGA